LPGINTPYWYISTCYGTWANLHIEDAKTGSVNLLLAGAPKDWLFIHQSSTYLLETCLRKEFPNLVKPCSQFVRHLNLILSPHWLRTREIAFSTVRQYPGQMICTLVGIYYQVVNCGENFAVAINFELDEW
ncbi:transcription factor jumonji, partial [Polyplosphaeria fusca]